MNENLCSRTILKFIFQFSIIYLFEYREVSEIFFFFFFAVKKKFPWLACSSGLKNRVYRIARERERKAILIRRTVWLPSLSSTVSTIQRETYKTITKPGRVETARYRAVVTVDITAIVTRCRDVDAIRQGQ